MSEVPASGIFIKSWRPKRSVTVQMRAILVRRRVFWKALCLVSCFSDWRWWLYAWHLQCSLSAALNCDCHTCAGASYLMANTSLWQWLWPLQHWSSHTILIKQKRDEEISKSIPYLLHSLRAKLFWNAHYFSAGLSQLYLTWSVIACPPAAHRLS